MAQNTTVYHDRAVVRGDDAVLAILESFAEEKGIQVEKLDKNAVLIPKQHAQTVKEAVFKKLEDLSYTETRAAQMRDRQNNK
uniref:Uncharacterized protein n=1 Tax=Chromera velia CCMP2878 TaxID=1169474 RepID=A0A0G4GEU6_9ALVE|mmetsp:Transcript_11919/g.22881  ORF Transcript_11919/g.22881 Transcript_11919/m.22881 type:complete len:82 (-) Transcript_11919:98-343(-)|eukprot:Cvel_21562.t1-p1 / transcript=Cvel_21562.t1 / gene=Cvel_21562 / organism=Chromera_velia_CCMP2878 / gene_product=hypothetical protein / transcript_product=hypothetical protein / location=Cvel_scaffold2033:31029-31841(-) / protein_length=81 / sequence_SO=supercontig / SO=protein_coding / is_pseudo=false